MSSAGQQLDPVMALAMQGSAPAPTTSQQGMDPVQALAMGHAPSPAAPPPPVQTASPSAWEKLRGGKLGGFVQGVVDPILGMGQMVANYGGMNPIVDSTNSTMSGEPASEQVQRASSHMVNQAVSGEINGYEGARGKVGRQGFDWARLAGNVLSPANAPIGALKLPSGLATAATQGTLYGLSQPTANAEGEDLAKAKALGGALGGASAAGGYLIAKGAAAVANPVYSAAKQKLIDAGVPLTVGQIVGGPVKTVEDALTHIPVLGNAIKSRQADSIKGWGAAVVNEALDPIGEKLPKGLSGSEAIEYADRALGDAYDRVVPNLSGRQTNEFMGAINGLKSSAKSDFLLPDAQAKQFGDIIDSQIMGKADASGNYTGEALKNIQSKLGFLARKYSKSPDPDQQGLGDAISGARQMLNDMIADQNPDHAATLQAINKGYAQFARVRQAAAALGAKDGVFTPAQLANSVKSNDSSVGKRSYAMGQALLQDWAKAGQDVLPSTVPDSGTALRGLLELGIGGAVTHELSPEAAMGAAGLIGGGTALYSAPAQSAFRAALTKRPASAVAIGKALQKYGPGFIGRAGAAAAASSPYVAPQMLVPQ